MNRLNEIVAKLYKQYQGYMYIEEMEDYKLEVKSTEEMGHTIASTMKKDGIRYLFLHEYLAGNLLSSVAERWEKGVLFHEFTHIADDSIMGKAGIPETKKYIVRPYIEYHAEFIKMLYVFGIHPFQNNRIKIPHTDIINSQYGNISIYDYLIKIKNGYVADIDVYTNTMETFIKNYDLLSYYLGTASVYRICCDYKIDEIMDVSGFTDKLGESAEQIKNTLLESVSFGFDAKVVSKCAKIYTPLIQPFLNK